MVSLSSIRAALKVEQVLTTPPEAVHRRRTEQPSRTRLVRFGPERGMSDKRSDNLRLAITRKTNLDGSPGEDLFPGCSAPVHGDSDTGAPQATFLLSTHAARICHRLVRGSTMVCYS